MARKSRYAEETLVKTKTAVLLAGVYSRLSIEDEDDEEQNSIGNQKKIVLDYLKDKSDILVSEYYSDNGFTGMNFNRPDFRRMMKDLRTGKINCVIVKDISRLGRHFVMTSEIVEKMFPMMGVRLISVNDDYDSADENCSSADLLLPFKMVMNDSYVKDISKKIRSSINAKIDQGEYLPSASSIPYGYIRNPEENTYDIDEEAAPVVVRIFEMRASGMSQNAIARILNEEGIPCPGKLRYNRGITKAAKYENALWIHGTLRKILQDQVYIGNRVHGRVKRDKLGMDKTRRSEDEWQIVENAHEPIVSKELYEAVQVEMQKTLEKHKGFKKQEELETDNRDLLREKVYCGDCGNLMRSGKGCGRTDKQGRAKTFVYYNCGKYVDSRHYLCENHYVRQEEIMSAITNALDNQLRVSVDLEQLLKEIQTMPKVTKYQSSTSGQLASVQAKRRNMEKRMEQLLIDLTDGLIDRDEYAYAKQRYSQEHDKLLEEENRVFASTKQLDAIMESCNQWIRALREYQRFPVINRELLDMLVKRILVYPGKKIKIELAFDDPYIAVNQYLNHVTKEVVEIG